MFVPLSYPVKEQTGVVATGAAVVVVAVVVTCSVTWLVGTDTGLVSISDVTEDVV